MSSEQLLLISECCVIITDDVMLCNAYSVPRPSVCYSVCAASYQLNFVPMSLHL